MSPKLAITAVLAVLVVALIVTLATGHRGERLVAGTQQGLLQQTAAAGFKVNTVHLQGASPVAQPDVLKAANVQAGAPILGVDLDAIRRQVEAVGWVKEARVIRLLPDTIVVAVVERDAQAVWQHNGHIVVVDHQGRIIPEADPSKFPELPLVVGRGANAALTDIMTPVMQRPRLRQKLEAMVRVDGRRWDLRLKDGSIIQLPATGEEQALMQLDELDRRERLLDLGFARIDLRDPEMIAVRPKEGGAEGGASAEGA
ncbi:MAG TPA: FtsQ-type POTRA domain-containing protein [Caulobacteraceae bacterium]